MADIPVTHQSQYVSTDITGEWYNSTADEGHPPAHEVVYAEETVKHNLWLYVSPIILFVGLINNSLSLLVVSRKRQGKKTPSEVFIGTLAVADSAVLLLGLLRFWIRELTDYKLDIRKLNGITCKLHYFGLYWMSHLSSWILVLLTVERTISVCMPMKVKSWFTIQRTLIGLAVTVGALACVNGHFFVTSGELTLQRFDGSVRHYPCTYMDSYKYFRKKVWPWLDLSILSFIPCSLIIIGNTAIVIKLTSSRLSMRNRVHPEGATSQSTSQKITTSLTVTLMTVSVMFLLTTIPLTIFNIVDKLDPPQSDHQDALFDLLYACLTLLYYCNSMCNFWLYCLSGRRFRREFFAIFKRKSANSFETTVGAG